MVATEDLESKVGVEPACEGLGVARSTLYSRRGHMEQEAKGRPKPPRALGEEERQRVLDVLHCEWHNTEHRHSGIGMLTPETVHYGLAEDVIEGRRKILEIAYRAHPERFVRCVHSPPPLPEAVWINPPARLCLHRRKLQ